MTLHHSQSGRGPALVLLHGWGMNAAVWEPLLAPLRDHLRLCVIELPGHGASAPAQSADLGDWAAQCLAVAPPRAHWLGWSLGGQLALRAALDAPDRVTGLSLIATTPRFVQTTDWACAMPSQSFHDFADALGDDPHATLLRFLGLQVKGAEHARATLRLLRAEIAQRPPASTAGLAQGLALLLHTDLRDRLARLRCASYWLFGARDTLVPPALADYVRGVLPDALCETIAGAGHAPFLSHPQACQEALLRRVVRP